jgi:hypothetical protein
MFGRFVILGEYFPLLFCFRHECVLHLNLIFSSLRRYCGISLPNGPTRTFRNHFRAFVSKNKYSSKDLLKKLLAVQLVKKISDLVDPEIDYNVQKSPLDCTLSQLNPVHIFRACFKGFLKYCFLLCPCISEVASRLLGFCLKFCNNFSSPPWVQLVSRIS